MSGIDPLMELLPDFGFILRASLSSSCACGDQGRKVWELFEEKYAWIYWETIHTRGERKLKWMFIQEHLQNQRLTWNRSCIFYKSNQPQLHVRHWIIQYGNQTQALRYGSELMMKCKLAKLSCFCVHIYVFHAVDSDWLFPLPSQLQWNLIKAAPLPVSFNFQMVDKP